ncbi:antitoxin Xre/MbcA/ParS toxin-binding domain-containing protein [Thauera sp. AutoDN2]|uniref:antitoxin Xre/MbcA/ParS toxin-binding domain-containing protein n=1 Tax=Thauera sp. AutoDN2 TaxID=3416051 RepID=UPI003F4B5288
MIYRALVSLVGRDSDFTRAWISSPNRAFANQTPKTILLQDDGLGYLSSAGSLR